MKKKLIIVCGDDEKKYAGYLQQLVSTRDDFDGEQVGIKDGSVDAVVWSEKQYEDNRPKLTSSNYVLFVGDGNEAKSARANMDSKFSSMGMHYGWLGTQAYLFVEGLSLNKDNIEEFKNMCAKYQKTFEKELDFHYAPSEVEGAQVDVKDVALVAIPAALVPAFGLLAPIAVAAGAGADMGKAVASIANVAVKQGKATFDRVVDQSQAKEARDQQYSLLTLIMYIDGLAEFMGE